MLDYYRLKLRLVQRRILNSMARRRSSCLVGLSDQSASIGPVAVIARTMNVVM